jgi:hypothetical protein
VTVGEETFLRHNGFLRFRKALDQSDLPATPDPRRKHPKRRQ